MQVALHRARISTDLFNENRINDIEAMENLAKQQIAEIKAFSSLEEEWDGLNFDEQRAILGIFVKSASVSPGHGADRLSVNWLV